jgi:protocatechuate 3,4-dioxygenase beta subunit
VVREQRLRGRALASELGSRALLLTVALLFAACGQAAGQPAASTPSPATSPAPAASPTAAGDGGATATCSGRVTPAVTEGPYFKAGSPERSSLLQPGISGTQLVLTGRVLAAGCRPLGGVVLDFWQADASGSYDNSGFRLRGHQVTDAEGRYSLTTVVPGEYPGRTEHIHVKVAAPGRPVLTTQLFFPGVARNAGDSIFDPELLVRLSDAATGKAGAFDFTLSA